MAEVTRTTAKTYFNTGDTPTEQQFANVMDSIPFPASDAVFTALSGTTWDGSFKSVTLTGNTALTFASTKRSGVLLVKQDATGSRTLTINGSSAAINSAANSTSIITFLYNDVISDYVFCVETLVVGVTGGLDTTAPTLLSAVVANAAPSNLVLTFNETLDSASTPATTDFDVQVNGASRNRDLVTISGATITLHLVSPIVNGDVITVSYLAGGVNKIQDVAGNDAPAFVNTAVTNNVAAVGTFTNTSRWALYKNSSMVRSGGVVTQWTNTDGDATRDFVQVVGNPYPVDATTDGMQMTASTENLKYATPQTITGAVTMYALIKRTGTGALLGGQNTNGYGIYTDATTMFFSPGTNAEGFQQNSTGIANMTAFHVLTLVWTPGSVAKVYLDGAVIGTFTGTITATGWKIYYVGGFNSDKFLGYIKGLALFNTAHDAATVAAQYSLFQTSVES
jgi:uncharacterized repeat protein (TIGR02059 family)